MNANWKIRIAALPAAPEFRITLAWQPGVTAGMRLTVSYDSSVVIQRSIDNVFRTIGATATDNYLLPPIIGAAANNWRRNQGFFLRCSGALYIPLLFGFFSPGLFLCRRLVLQKG